MKSLTKNLIPEVINQAISNKIVRKLAVRQLDKKIHDSIMEDQSLLFEEEKLDRYHFVSNVVKQVSNIPNRLKTDWIYSPVMPA